MAERAKGYAGYQLRVNLERLETQIETVAETTNRKFLGGAGYAAKLLFD